VGVIEWEDQRNIIRPWMKFASFCRIRWNKTKMVLTNRFYSLQEICIRPPHGIEQSHSIGRNFSRKKIDIFVIDITLTHPNNLSDILRSFYLECNWSSILMIKTRYSKSMNHEIKKECNSIYFSSNRWFDFVFSFCIFEVRSSYISWVQVEF
jgi:hypothetical protein